MQSIYAKFTPTIIEIMSRKMKTKKKQTSDYYFFLFKPRIGMDIHVKAEGSC